MLPLLHAIEELLDEGIAQPQANAQQDTAEQRFQQVEGEVVVTQEFSQQGCDQDQDGGGTHHTFDAHPPCPAREQTQPDQVDHQHGDQYRFYQQPLIPRDDGIQVTHEQEYHQKTHHPQTPQAPIEPDRELLLHLQIMLCGGTGMQQDPGQERDDQVGRERYDEDQNQRHPIQLYLRYDPQGDTTAKQHQQRLDASG